MGLGANGEMGQVSGGGYSVAAMDSTEHISVPCIKGLQEPKTQPWRSAPDPRPQRATGTHWMILGLWGLWNLGIQDLCRWEDPGAQGASKPRDARMCRERSKAPCERVHVCVHSTRGQSPRDACELARGRSQEKKNIALRKENHRSEGKTKSRRTKREEGWPSGVGSEGTREESSGGAPRTSLCSGTGPWRRKVPSRAARGHGGDGIRVSGLSPGLRRAEI